MVTRFLILGIGGQQLKVWWFETFQSLLFFKVCNKKNIPGQGVHPGKWMAGTWKWPNWKGTSCSKPPIIVFYVNFPGVVSTILSDAGLPPTFEVCQKQKMPPCWSLHKKKHPRRSGQGVSLGGGFQYFLFSPLLGEDSHFDEHIFQGGWFNHQPDIYHEKTTCITYIYHILPLKTTKCR